MRKNGHVQRQIIVFGCLYIGYFLYIYVRKSFSFSAAVISEELQLEKSDLGVIASSQALAYTIGKFLSGLLVDRLSPKLLFSAGLLLSGLFTILFSGCQTVWVFCLLWFLNGLTGGAGWPACAKFLKTWYPPNELGTLWSALSTSMNVAGSLGPLLTMYLVGQYGWRWTMCLPGIAAVMLAVISHQLLINKPSDIGLPELIGVGAKKKSDDDKPVGNVTLRDILTPFFFKICLGYLVTMCIRSASSDWGQLYLIQDQGHSHAVGSGFTSCQEVGGIIGSLTAGYASDKVIEKSNKQTGSGRMIVVLINSLVITMSLFCLVTMVTPTSSQVLISGIGFCLGFSLYGSIAMYGVMAVESAPLQLSGTAHSIVAVAANVGLMLAGLPLSWVAGRYLWVGAFRVLLAGAVLQVPLTLSCLFTRGDQTKKAQ